MWEKIYRARIGDFSVQVKRTKDGKGPWGFTMSRKGKPVSNPGTTFLTAKAAMAQAQTVIEVAAAMVQAAAAEGKSE